MHTPEEIAEQQFLISLRGYDRDEVSAFLDEVAGQVRTLQQRIADLEAARDEPPQPSGAPEREDAGGGSSFRELGQETTRILEAAEEAAEQMRTRASEEARTLVEEARREAAREREEAEEHASTIVEDAQRQAQEERTRANETATQVLEEARRSARETLDTAQAQHREVAETVRELDQVRAQLIEDLRAVGGTIEDAVGRLDRDPDDGPAVTPPEDISLEDLTEQVDAPGPGPAVPQDEEPVAEAGAGEAVPAEDDSEGGPSPAVADVASRELRDQALAGIRPGMLRRLKRTLQDVQNGVLDAIRREGAQTDVVNLLPTDDELAPLHSVGEAFLGEAYRAGLGDGATLAAVAPDGQAEQPERVVAAAEDFRNTVGHEVVAALEPTLAAGLEADEDPGALGERVSEVFRDLKGPAAESAADQSLLRIHSLGVHDAWVNAGIGKRVWVVGDEARCPENRCRANADEGPVGFDDPFPSGDSVPPAHPGCTCTLAPA